MAEALRATKFEILNGGVACQVCVEITSTSGSYPIFFATRHADPAAALTDVQGRLAEMHINTEGLVTPDD